MLIVALVASLGLGLLRGGGLSAFARVRFRGTWFYLIAWGLQWATVERLWPGRVDELAYPLSFGLLTIGTCLDINIKGMRWVALGVFLNGIAIAANGGKMPVRLPSDIEFSGSAQASTHAVMLDNARLSFLGDTISMPVPYGHHLLLSPGDILIAAGVFAVVQYLMKDGPGVM